MSTFIIQYLNHSIRVILSKLYDPRPPYEQTLELRSATDPTNNSKHI